MRIIALVALLLAAALANEIRQKRQFIYTSGFGYPAATSLSYGFTGYSGLTYPSFGLASYPSYGLTYGYPSTTFGFGYPSYGGLVFGK